MANCCFVTFVIDFGSKEDAAQCHKWLEAKQEADASKNHCFELGTDSKFYILDDYVGDLSEDSLEISGWVRWAIDGDAMIEAVTQLVHHYDIKHLSCHYNECGCEIYGHWEYDQSDHLLIDWAVQPDYIRKYYEDHKEDFEHDEDGSVSDAAIDHFCDAPEEAYAEDTVVEIS